MEEVDILKRALVRERASRKAAEAILEAKSAELYNLNKKLETSHEKLNVLYNKTTSQLQGVFENIVDAYVIMDLWGNVLKMNDAAVELLGFQSAKDDYNLIKIVNPKEVHRIAPAFRTLNEKGSITDFKIKIVTLKKEHKLIHINASIIYENNIPVAAQGIIRDITLDNNYQLAIESEKQKYSNVIANMNLGLVEVNNNDEILMVNQSFEIMSGYSAKELIGKKGSELFFEPSNNTINSETRKRIRGESSSYELNVKTKAGDLRCWLVSGAPNYDAKGNVIGSIGIHLDITEGKRNLKLLKEKKDELDIILNNASIGIVLGKNEKILRTNPSFNKMLGYKSNELFGKNMSHITVLDDFYENQHNLDKLSQGLIDNFIINKRFRCKDKSYIWARTNVSGVRDYNGELKYQIATIEDITTERNKSLIFQMINNLTKSILGKINVNELAWEIVNILGEYLQTEDCVIYVVDNTNKTLQQVAALGNKLDEDKNILNKLTFSFGEGIVGEVAKTGKSELIKDTSKDSRYVIDDKMRFSEITVPIIRNSKVIGIIDAEHININYFTKEHLKTLESVAHIVGIQIETAVNISKREKAEATNNELLEKLEKSNFELHEYAHIVSHDLKSPLRSINALVNWLKEDNQDKFDENSLQNLSHIEAILEKMELLISNVLEYSGINSNDYDTEYVDLNELINELSKILLIPKHIKFNVTRRLPIVKGDKVKLQQLFQNLIGNAIKFNDKKEGLIELDIEDENSFFQFSISDNGMGIEKQYHDKIFKMFNALNKSKNSTGIGLSIVKKIVDLYKGQIWVESEYGKGTTFHFTLKK
ncbi:MULTISPECIES: PAS domain S-box protein [unclassified Winogradskyella]|uniref:PAS domain S-box protein n=1 Tax=unclassified Winogradskyella TaxID=2615021 RepID=UPI001E5C294E|nr:MULTISPECIES: PAS domain S-box protein [unclassified Winogradskyella]